MGIINGKIEDTYLNGQFAKAALLTDGEAKFLKVMEILDLAPRGSTILNSVLPEAMRVVAALPARQRYQGLCEIAHYARGTIYEGTSAKKANDFVAHFSGAQKMRVIEYLGQSSVIPDVRSRGFKETLDVLWELPSDKRYAAAMRAYDLIRAQRHLPEKQDLTNRAIGILIASVSELPQAQQYDAAKKVARCASNANSIYKAEARALLHSLPKPGQANPGQP